MKDEQCKCHEKVVNPLELFRVSNKNKLSSKNNTQKKQKKKMRRKKISISVLSCNAKLPWISVSLLVAAKENKSTSSSGGMCVSWRMEVMWGQRADTQITKLAAGPAARRAR